MHAFKLFLSLGAFLAATSAAPVGNETELAIRGDSPGDRCGDTLWVDKTSGGSPTIFDCAAIVYRMRISSPNQDRLVYLDDPSRPATPVESYGSCVFGVKSSFSRAQGGNGVIGTNDIADLIDDAIKRFGRDDKIGAEGAMYCLGQGTWWGIWHT